MASILLKSAAWWEAAEERSREAKHRDGKMKKIDELGEAVLAGLWLFAETPG